MEVGRREALPDLDWERLRSAIAVVVLRRVPRHAVEDLVQDVLLALWTAQRARRPAAPMSRARSIARNKCNDWHRRRAREASVFVPSPSSHELASHAQVPTAGPSDLANLRRDTPSGHRPVAMFDLPPHRQREFVLASLDRLPPRQRRVARAIFSGLRATRAIARAARIHPSDCREVIAALPGAIRRILPLVPPPRTTRRLESSRTLGLHENPASPSRPLPHGDVRCARLDPRHRPRHTRCHATAGIQHLRQHARLRCVGGVLGVFLGEWPGRTRALTLRPSR
ncbi:MAG: sigma-70 family RNA polymerase sigma factor [Planctomycetes bacterium]|nr:sigma-70 family RNA polymerase sigma factor [Planctomycetota bacterium]